MTEEWPIIVPEKQAAEVTEVRPSEPAVEPAPFPEITDTEIEGLRLSAPCVYLLPDGTECGAVGIVNLVDAFMTHLPPLCEEHAAIVKQDMQAAEQMLDSEAT